MVRKVYTPLNERTGEQIDFYSKREAVAQAKEWAKEDPEKTCYIDVAEQDEEGYFGEGILYDIKVTI